MTQILCKDKKIRPKHSLLTKEVVVQKANYVINEYVKIKNWKKPEDLRLDLNDIYENVIYPEFEFKVINSIKLGYYRDEKILGKTVFKDRVVLIDQSIAPSTGDPRYAWTVAHEFGHAINHSGNKDLFRCTTNNIFNKSDILEIQANWFAEHIIMPEWLVKFRIQQCYKPEKPFRYDKPGSYWFTPFGVSRKVYIESYTHFCKVVVSPIKEYFCNISKESFALKIHKMGLVQNCSKEELFKKEAHIGNSGRNIRG